MAYDANNPKHYAAVPHEYGLGKSGAGTKFQKQIFRAKNPSSIYRDGFLTVVNNEFCMIDENGESIKQHGNLQDFPEGVWLNYVDAPNFANKRDFTLPGDPFSLYVPNLNSPGAKFVEVKDVNGNDVITTVETNIVSQEKGISEEAAKVIMPHDVELRNDQWQNAAVTSRKMHTTIEKRKPMGKSSVSE